MSTPAPVTKGAPAAPVNSRGRVIVASLVGTSIEFYDFYVYATAAVLVFPALFFPNASGAVALLSSFAVFGVAFIARPLGSIVFGHFGDKYGRKGTLVASLLTMGIATFLIGCLPTAQVDGWSFWAPALLVVMRFAQGLALGGEWSGAALLATENAPANKRAIYGTFPQLGAPIGFIIANSLFLSVEHQPDQRPVHGLGLAHSLPGQRRDGHHRPVGPAEAGRDSGLPEGRGQGRGHQAAVGRVSRPAGAS